jgi:hypothetical protein
MSRVLRNYQQLFRDAAPGQVLVCDENKQPKWLDPEDLDGVIPVWNGDSWNAEAPGEAPYIPASGGVVQQLTVVGTPTASGDAANKGYVDVAASGGGFDPAASQTITAPWVFEDALETQNGIVSLTGLQVYASTGSVNIQAVTGAVQIVSGTGIAMSGSVSMGVDLLTDPFLSMGVAGEAEPRVLVDGDGSFNFGDGAAPADTKLYRYGPAQMAVDGFVISAAGALACLDSGIGTGLIIGPSNEINMYLDGGLARLSAGLIVDGTGDFREGASIGDGPSKPVGFHGVTPIAQQATPVTLGDVISVLQNLGLVA